MEGLFAGTVSSHFKYREYFGIIARQEQDNPSTVCNFSTIILLTAQIKIQ